MYKIPANTLFMGKDLIFMPECHSTNTIALDLCQQSDRPEGCVVITDKQLSGRGQRGNTWESEPGMNLTFSVILKPTFLAIKNQFILSVMTSLAVYDYLSNIFNEKSIAIKWPNDILVNEFKICGILIENQLVGDKLAHSVVGIGLNVNQQHFGSNRATSLAIVGNKVYTLQAVFEGVLGCLEARYLQLRQNKADMLKRTYLDHLYRINESHQFISGTEVFTGKIIGVDETGRLKVENEGKEKVFDVKQIAFAN